MTQQTLQNILFLSRKGLSVISEKLSPDEGIACYTALKELEEEIKKSF